MKHGLGQFNQASFAALATALPRLKMVTMSHSVLHCIGIACVAQASVAMAQSPADEVARLGQVTVTAQSRAQSSQAVPIALNVISSQTIDAVEATDLSRLNLFVPGLQVNAGEPTQAVFRLRGIETSDFGIGTDSAVGIFIDGVQQSRAGGGLMALNDVARVEVLKGPQGTLFGRNTAAGAIAIISNEPGDSRELRARIRVGNHGRRYADALINLPMQAGMAVRLSALNNHSDGWIRDAASGQRYGKDGEWGTRLSWRWDATPATRITLAWSHDQLRQPGRTDLGLIPLSSDPRQRPAFPANPANYL
ncbi:MAG: TonB-dependent receptor, partial [Rhodanobacter sp.]